MKKTLRAIQLTGLVMVLGGLGHFFGVTEMCISDGMPDGRHLAYLVYIGLIHLTVGALDLWSSLALRRRVPGALPAMGLATLLVCAFGVIETPLVAEAALTVRVPSVLYPVAHLVLFALLRRGLKARDVETPAVQ